MALGKCRECGRQVSTAAKVCPGCGVSKPVKKSDFLGAVAAVAGCLIVLKVCSGIGGKPDAPTDPKAAAIRERSEKCAALAAEAVELKYSVRNGKTRVPDGVDRIHMIEADAKENGCAKLADDRVEYVRDKHATAPASSK